MVGSVAERVTPLTAESREIAEAVMRGATSAQVAANSTCGRTVENHLQHVFRKLGITRRAELPVRLKRMERNLLPMAWSEPDWRSGGYLTFVGRTVSGETRSRCSTGCSSGGLPTSVIGVALHRFAFPSGAGPARN